MTAATRQAVAAVLPGVRADLEALVRVPAVRPDVAVLDVRLPDGNGVEVCRELRSQRPDLRCLMLTSFADDDALLDAVMAGAAGYVLKQIRGSDLVEGIRAQVDERTESVGKKIREAELRKVPFMLVVGDQEQADGTVAVRRHRDGDQGAEPVSEFARQISAAILARE